MANSLSDTTQAIAGCLGAVGHVATATVEAQEPAGSQSVLRTAQIDAVRTPEDQQTSEVADGAGGMHLQT